MREAWCCICVYEHYRLFYWCSLLNFHWRQRVYANGVYFLTFVEDRGVRECCTCLPWMSTNIHHSRTPPVFHECQQTYTISVHLLSSKNFQHTPLAYTLCLSRMSTYTICVHPLYSMNVQQTYTTKIIECSYTQVQHRALHTHVR